MSYEKKYIILIFPAIDIQIHFFNLFAFTQFFQFLKLGASFS